MIGFTLLSACLALEAADVDGVVGFSFNRVTHPLAGAESQSDLSKRAQAGSLKQYLDHISNQRFFYTSNVQIGTPAQQISLLMDTGSSDTWVMGQGTSGGFNSGGSSTYHANGTDWTIQYGIGSASGSWGTDKFSIGGATVKHLSFGTANRVNQITQGIVGLGRKEAETTSKQGHTYNNLPFQMKAEGLIGSAAYSLFMDDINAHSGTILFGGVDHSKYKGQLVSMPVVHPRHLGVTLHGIYSDGRSNDNNMGRPAVAVLDSGTSLSYVDSDTLSNIRTALNANPSFSIGEKYYCDCNITENLVFDFGNTKVAVPAYNFLWPIDEFVQPGQLVGFPQNSCYLGIEESSRDENFMLLGDNVLRGMYVVYDVEHNQVAVAAASNNRAAAQVEAISGARIPGTLASYIVSHDDEKVLIEEQVYA